MAQGLKKLIFEESMQELQIHSVIKRWLAGHKFLATAFWWGELNLTSVPWVCVGKWAQSLTELFWEGCSALFAAKTVFFFSLEILYGVMLGVQQAGCPLHHSGLGSEVERDWKWRRGAARCEDLVPDLRGTENAETWALISLGSGLRLQN